MRVAGTNVQRFVNTQTDRLRTLKTTQLLMMPQNRTAIWIKVRFGWQPKPTGW